MRQVLQGRQVDNCVMRQIHIATPFGEVGNGRETQASAVDFAGFLVQFAVFCRHGHRQKSEQEEGAEEKRRGDERKKRKEKMKEGEDGKGRGIMGQRRNVKLQNG